MISAGRGVKDETTGKRGKRRQWRLKIAIPESYGPPQSRRALAVARLADIIAMRDALVAVGRGAKAQYLMRQAGSVAGDEEKFQFAIAAANVVMSRPSERASEASTRFDTWGRLARAWGSQELARLYPNAGYGKKSAQATDEPRIEYLCKFIENVPLATFTDDDYWRAMRPARERCRTDATFKAYAQVARRVLKIAVELRIIPAWPLSAVCKLPIVAKGEAPEFPFLYPEEYCRLMRCPLVPIQFRVLWGFILREGVRLGEAFRIRWEHLARLPEQPGQRARWVLNVPETKTGRALMFVLNAGTGEVLEAFRALRPELAGPFVWLSPTNLKKAADTLRRHIEQSGTTRERLLFTEGRLRRLREHDLRSTYVSWSKLAGVDNETIAQHTGHESNAMIARYNRSKQTIEHLGLAPYLPLDQAMALDVAGGLGARLVTEGGERLPELGAGEVTSTEIDESVNLGSTSAPGPGRESLPPADLGGRRLVTSTLRLPVGPGNGEATGGIVWPESAPTNGEALLAAVSAALGPEGEEPEPAEAPLAPAQQRGAQGRRGGSAGLGAPRRRRSSPVREGASNAVEKPDTEAAPLASGYAPGALLAARFEALEPLNGCNPCDLGCDHSLAGAGAPMLGIDETSRKDAACAREGSNLHTQWVPEPKSCRGPPETTNPEETEPGPAPERTGSNPGSHGGVTTPAAPLELLQAAARAYLEQRAWAALAALQPLIDAEVARLAEAVRADLARQLEAARGAPPAPVQLAVVRAQREERGRRG